MNWKHRAFITVIALALAAVALGLGIGYAVVDTPPRGHTFFYYYNEFFDAAEGRDFYPISIYYCEDVTHEDAAFIADVWNDLAEHWGTGDLFRVVDACHYSSELGGGDLPTSPNVADGGDWDCSSRMPYSGITLRGNNAAGLPFYNAAHLSCLYDRGRVSPEHTGERILKATGCQISLTFAHGPNAERWQRPLSAYTDVQRWWWRSVLAHEVGHCVGLHDHNDGTDGTYCVPTLMDGDFGYYGDNVTALTGHDKIDLDWLFRERVPSACHLSCAACTATPTPVPTATLIPTATLVPTATLIPTRVPTAVPTHTPRPTYTPQATHTSVPVSTATVSPAPTVAPTQPVPTSTPVPATPTNTPTPVTTATPDPWSCRFEDPDAGTILHIDVGDRLYRFTGSGFDTGAREPGQLRELPRGTLLVDIDRGDELLIVVGTGECPAGPGRFFAVEVAFAPALRVVRLQLVDPGS